MRSSWARGKTLLVLFTPLSTVQDGGVMPPVMEPAPVVGRRLSYGAERLSARAAVRWAGRRGIVARGSHRATGTSRAMRRAPRVVRACSSAGHVAMSGISMRRAQAVIAQRSVIACCKAKPKLAEALFLLWP